MSKQASPHIPPRRVIEVVRYDGYFALRASNISTEVRLQADNADDAVAEASRIAICRISDIDIVNEHNPLPED